MRAPWAQVDPVADYLYHKLVDSDLDFLVSAVLAAEQVPSLEEVCTYERVFGLTRDECKQFLRETLSLETAGHQLARQSFHVIAYKGKPVACCSAWIEAADGQPSGLKVAMILSRFLGTSRWRAHASSVSVVASCSPKRTAGALQLETFFVEPQHRRNGMTGQLIEYAIVEHSNASSAPEHAEITLFRENEQAARAYVRAGFELVWETTIDTASLESLTASKGFLQLRRSLAIVESARNA